MKEQRPNNPRNKSTISKAKNSKNGNSLTNGRNGKNGKIVKKKKITTKVAKRSEFTSPLEPAPTRKKPKVPQQKGLVADRSTQPTQPIRAVRVLKGKKTKGNNETNKSPATKSSNKNKRQQSKNHDFYQSLLQQAKQQITIQSKDADNTDPYACSAPGMSMKRSLANMAVLEDLHAGIPVIKISRNGDHHRRYLTLSQDQCTLCLTHSKVDNETHPSRLPQPFWTPSKGLKGHYFRYLDVADIIDAQMGVSGTQILEMGVKPNKREAWKDQMVTIFHYERFQGKQHLNLLGENPRHRMALVGALATMKERYEDQSSWIGKEVLLLRYWWYEVDMDQTMVISEREFLQLCERLLFYVPNLSKEFRFFCKEMGAAKGQKHKLKLTYGECTLLLNKLKSNLSDKQAVDVIWKAFFKNATTIDADRFYKQVLCTIQGERDATLGDAKALIACLNTMELGDTKTDKQGSGHKFQLDKNRFEEYLKSPWNDAFCPSQQALPSKGLHKPLSAYFINTSHRTYWIGGRGTYADRNNPISVEAYSRALQRGAKCLELDVQDGWEQRRGELIPIIQPIPRDDQPHQQHQDHHQPHPLELQRVLLVVNNYLTKHPQTYPIILCIENNCSRPYQDAMANMIKSTFGTRLFIPNDTQRTTRNCLLQKS